MATIGNVPVFPTQSVLPGNLEVTGTSATVNGNEVRTVGTSGAILQVVQASTTTEVNVQSTTYTDTTLTASITPTSSSNKILVIVNQTFQLYRSSGGNNGGGIRILRDSTAIYTPVSTSTGPLTEYHGVGTSMAKEDFTNTVIHYLDSPSTTSSVTYKTQGRVYVTSNGSRIRFQYGVSTTVDGRSDIILMEIVA